MNVVEPRVPDGEQRKKRLMVPRELVRLARRRRVRRRRVSPAVRVDASTDVSRVGVVPVAHVRRGDQTALRTGHVGERYSRASRDPIMIISGRRRRRTRDRTDDVRAVPLFVRVVRGTVRVVHDAPVHDELALPREKTVSPVGARVSDADDLSLPRYSSVPQGCRFRLGRDHGSFSAGL